MYLWIKAIHIISIISWMAGLLYLPRLFVYHCKCEENSELSLTLQIMEKRLLRLIMNPAMIVSLITGFLLVIEVGVSGDNNHWLPLKILLVFGLAGSHMSMAKWRKDFEQNRNVHSERFFRIVNEVPTLLMILIVFLVILKPF